MPTEISPAKNLNFSISAANFEITSNFYQADGTKLLATYDSANKPLLLLFGGVACSGCVLEHQHIQAAIVGGELDLTKFNVITFLVGSDQDNLNHLEFFQDFRSDANFSWPMTGDKTLNIFKANCKEYLTPCTAIYLPNQGQVFSEIGEVPVSTLKGILY